MEKQKMALKKSDYRVLQLFLLMLGTVVGVGFISGAEVYSFFARFERFFVFGIIGFFVLFSILTYKILTQNKLIKNDVKLQNFDNNYQNNTILRKIHIKNIFVCLNVFLIASAMLSGLKTVINQLFVNNQTIVFLVSVIFVFFVLARGVKSLAKVNYFVISFLLFVTVFLLVELGKGSSCSANFSSGSLLANNSFIKITLSILFSFLYIFMNIVELEPVVREFDIEFQKKQAKIFSVIFGLVLTLILVVFCLFLQFTKKYSAFAMPLLVFFEEKSLIFKLIFSVGLVVCLLTTLTSCLLGVKRRVIDAFDVSNIFASFVVLLAALCVSILPFTVFVNVIYPIIGIINFVIYVFL